MEVEENSPEVPGQDLALYRDMYHCHPGPDGILSSCIQRGNQGKEDFGRVDTFTMHRRPLVYLRTKNY